MSISAEAGGATAVRVRANKRAKRVFFIMGNDLVSIRLLRVLAGIANGHVNFGGGGRGDRSESEGEQESENGFLHNCFFPFRFLSMSGERKVRLAACRPERDNWQKVFRFQNNEDSRQGRKPKRRKNPNVDYNREGRRHEEPAAQRDSGARSGFGPLAQYTLANSNGFWPAHLSVV